jgi:aquaporin PIP
MSQYATFEEPRRTDWSCDFKNMFLTETVNVKFLRAVFAEYIATSAFLWITIQTVTYMYGSPSFLLAVATSFGLSIAVLVSVFADVSGGHINPAVSLGLFLRGKISFVRLVSYTSAQCLGAMTGSALVKAAGAAAYDTVTGGANKVFVDTTGQAVLAEMVGTSLLVFTVFTVCDENKTKNNVGWLAIGLSVFLAHLALLGATNTSINPARSFGAAVVSDYWDNHWVWWVGPYLGAVLAAVLYEFFKARKGLDY